MFDQSQTETFSKLTIDRAIKRILHKRKKTESLGVQEVYLDFIENQGIKLLYNLLQTKEIEYIFYILRIFDWLLNLPMVSTIFTLEQH